MAKRPAKNWQDKLNVLGTAHKAVALRRKMRLSQTDFWRMVGVTQTAGSRYEAAAGPAWANARKIPDHVQAIGAIVFAKDEQARQSVVDLLVCEKWFAMDVACDGSEIHASSLREVPSLPGVTVTDRAKNMVKKSPQKKNFVSSSDDLPRLPKFLGNPDNR